MQYKKNMAPLVVFLVDSSDLFLVFDKISREKNYHRCFVFTNQNLKNNFNFKNTDNIFVFNYLNNKLQTLLKMILSFTKSEYSHFIFVENSNMNIDKELDFLKKNNFFKNSSGFGFEKKYYVFNDIEYIFNKKTSFNLLEIAEIMDKAFKKEKLNNDEFIAVIDELIPMAEFEFDMNLNIDENLRSIFIKKHTNNEIKFLITNDFNRKDKNIICLAYDIKENSKINIFRNDNLIFSM